MMQVTYQKRDGSIIHRLRSTSLPYSIGEETSMGWKVLNIEYNYNGKYYSKNEYDLLIQKIKQRHIMIRQLKTNCKKSIITLLNYIIGLLILTLFNI